MHPSTECDLDLHRVLGKVDWWSYSSPSLSLLGALFVLLNINAINTPSYAHLVCSLVTRNGRFVCQTVCMSVANLWHLVVNEFAVCAVSAPNVPGSAQWSMDRQKIIKMQNDTHLCACLRSSSNDNCNNNAKDGHY